MTLVDCGSFKRKADGRFESGADQQGCLPPPDDFLSGVAYANNGQIQRVANSTYIITPYNVDIMGDLLDELENSGVFF